MQNEFVTPKSIFPAIPPALAGHGTSDDVLVNRVAAGNRLAMHVLFARHHARVYRFILRWVGDASIAEVAINAASRRVFVMAVALLRLPRSSRGSRPGGCSTLVCLLGDRCD